MMKKTYSKKNRLKITAIILSTALIAASSGCSKKESETVNKELYNTPLSEYIETSQYMQEKISINFDTSKIEWKEKANIYDCEIREFDRENIKEKLLKGNITEEITEGYSGTNGKGIAYTTDAKERIIFNTGEISYSYPEGEYLEFPQNSTNNLNDELIQSYFGYSIDDYGKNISLGSQRDYEEVAEELLQTLNKIGIDDAELYVSYALDCGTMNEQNALLCSYKEKNGTDGDPDYPQIKEKVYTQEDEGYLMLFRQVIDEIPLLMKDYDFFGINEKGITPDLKFFYSDFGVYKFNMSGWIEADKESAQENELISPAQAMEALLKKYDSSILVQEIKIDAMELSYMPIAESKGGNMYSRSYKIIPVWAFEVGEETTVNDDIEGSHTYFDYNYILINAVTGEEVTSPFIE